MPVTTVEDCRTYVPAPQLNTRLVPLLTVVVRVGFTGALAGYNCDWGTTSFTTPPVAPDQLSTALAATPFSKYSYMMSYFWLAVRAMVPLCSVAPCKIQSFTSCCPFTHSRWPSSDFT